MGGGVGGWEGDRSLGKAGRGRGGSQVALRGQFWMIGLEMQAETGFPCVPLK